MWKLGTHKRKMKIVVNPQVILEDEENNPPILPELDDNVKEPADNKVERPQLDYAQGTWQAGTGSYQVVPGNKTNPVDQVLGLTTAKLPVGKVKNGQVIPDGTYALDVQPNSVTMSPVERQLAIPKTGVAKQQREYTKAIPLTDGSATFTIRYDGSILGIHPADSSAERALQQGEASHNVDVMEKALHVAFSEMGLELEDLDAIYVYLS